VLYPKLIHAPLDVDVFVDALKGETFLDVRRRGKFLLFDTERYTLVSHLRMEGKYGIYPYDQPVENHTHVRFHFTDKTELRYKDVRKFGTFHLFQKGKENDQLPLSHLGPEPLSDEFVFDGFYQTVKKSHRSIKAILLDQTVVVGLGNIYVDEALFRAKIHPEKKGQHVTKKEFLVLFDAIRQTLQEAVEKGGSTVRTYVNTDGAMGMFQLDLFVYAKENQPCRVCGKTIVKTRVAGRGTHYCRKCQKQPRRE
jgi:formamidopyrimidine-DNA glycosylase